MSPLKYIWTHTYWWWTLKGWQGWLLEREREGERDKEREGEMKSKIGLKWAALMSPPAAVRPSHSLSAKWTPLPYCSHSAHLLHPSLSSSSSLSSFPISSLPENGYWESILHHKSNHIILSFSIPTLSLPPSTSFLLYHFPISPPFPSSAWLSLCLHRKRTLMRWKMEAKGWGIFAFLDRDPINWRLCRPNDRLQCWNCTIHISYIIYNISVKWTTLD